MTLVLDGGVPAVLAVNVVVLVVMIVAHWLVLHVLRVRRRSSSVVVVMR